MKLKKIISYVLTFIAGIVFGLVGLFIYLSLPRYPDFNFTGQPYDDARFASAFKAGEFNPEYIVTYVFNADNSFQGSNELAASILEAGKNPGLGVRALHERGITGAGVRVAIIDQNLAMTRSGNVHPEYRDNLEAYHVFGANSLYGEESSMHGTAVASLLVGSECGTAPDAILYYAATPSWTGDSQYEADALRWIIQENAMLPDDDKIRVVSVSAAPSGPGSPRTLNTEQWDEAVAEATAAGILVLDCRRGFETGFITAAYLDLDNPDDITLIQPGYPGLPVELDENMIYVPVSRRTQAEENRAGVYSFQYTGRGGLSWSIPYAAGVLAMGWQINPQLGNDEIVALLFQTAYVNEDGFRFINPPAFIEAVIATAD